MRVALDKPSNTQERYDQCVYWLIWRGKTTAEESSYKNSIEITRHTKVEIALTLLQLGKIKVRFYQGRVFLTTAVD